MAVAVIACNGTSDANQCGHPDDAKFSCPNSPNDAGICVGAPGTEQSSFGPLPAGTGDAAYPIGCSVKLPFCHPSYPAEPAACICASGDDGGQWVCPQ
jgi:hypothetical protein